MVPRGLTSPVAFTRTLSALRPAAAPVMLFARMGLCTQAYVVRHVSRIIQCAPNFAGALHQRQQFDQEASNLLELARDFEIRAVSRAENDPKDRIRMASEPKEDHDAKEATHPRRDRCQ